MVDYFIDNVDIYTTWLTVFEIAQIRYLLRAEKIHITINLKNY